MQFIVIPRKTVFWGDGEVFPLCKGYSQDIQSSANEGAYLLQDKKQITTMMRINVFSSDDLSEKKVCVK